MAEREEPPLSSHELLQCPVCGELLRAEGEHLYTFCHYCETALKLARGRSGRPMASPAAVRLPTEEEELRRAYEQSWNELASLLREREELRHRAERAKSVHETRWDRWLAGAGTIAAVLFLIVAAYRGDEAFILAAVAAYLLGRGAFYVIRGIAETRKETVARQYRPQLEELARRTRELEVHMEELEERLAMAAGYQDEG
ncbi:MAG: hypothetical protein HPY83_03165 [Anaerolineae bacterium]|nr:hypothetical protein [Anaerolineae bacterium]